MFLQSRVDVTEGNASLSPPELEVTDEIYNNEMNEAQNVSSLNETDFDTISSESMPHSREENRASRFRRLAGYYEPTQPSLISETKESSYDTSMAEIIRPTEDQVSTAITPWPEGTVCIMGDSQLLGINEKRLSRDKKVKVRAERGAVIEDMFDHVNAVLRRKPSFIILHIGTNNTINQDYISIVNGIIRLKRYIETKLETCKVIISLLFMRSDNRSANHTITRVNALLQEMNFEIIDNNNISDVHLGEKGLHLNKRGRGRFALNLISHIRCL